MNTPAPIRISGLARRLVNDQLLTEEQAIAALEGAAKSGQHLVAHLVAEGLVDSTAIATAASQEYGVSLFDLDAMDREQMPISLVDEKLINKHHALPLFQRGKRLFLAVSDPTDHQGLDEIKFHTGLATDAVLVEEHKLKAALDHALEAQDAAMSEMLDADLESLDIDVAEEKDEDDANLGVDDAPVVRYVNKILLDAINGGASDIHFEPYEKNFRVRFRQDGILHEVATPPVNLAPVSRPA